MKSAFFIPLACAAALLLCGCMFMMGDKFEERVRCPRNEETKDYQIHLECGIVTSYTDQNAKGAILKISKDSLPRCSVPYSPTSGASKFISSATIAITYPAFKPVKVDRPFNDRGMHVLMHVSPNCGYKHLDQNEQSKEFARQIANNAGHTDVDGKHHFAPIVALESNWYLQENVREGDLNGSLYFLKDNSDKIALMLGCDRTGSCYSRNTVVSNDCSATYVLRNIPYQEFISSHRRIEEFIQKNCVSAAQ